MKIKIIVLLLSLFSCRLFAENISITVKYSEAANIFVLMDCVSGWWSSSYCTDRGEYRKAWQAKYPITPEDAALFERYDTIRGLYYKGLGLPVDEKKPTDGLFAARATLSEDLISPVFFSSKTLPEALAKLKNVVAAQDVVFFQKYYQHFHSRYQAWIDESKSLAEKAQATHKKMQNKKYFDFFTKIARYYGVKERMDYNVLYVWWPPIRRDSAFPVDRFLIFQQNPNLPAPNTDEEIIFHEIMHTLSARQNQKQKEAITQAFLKECPRFDERFPKGQKGKALEEPLAVAIGQQLFLKEFFPQRLYWESSLYNNAWISLFAKLIFPVIEEEIKAKKTLSVNTGKKMGMLCKEFFAASVLLPPGS